MSSPQPPAPPATPVPPVPAPAKAPRGRSFSAGWTAKTILLASVDALGVYIVLQAFAVGSYGIAAGFSALLVLVNWAYFSRRAIPMKYIVPGLCFLLVYQVFTVAYTGYVAFTNYGHGHNSVKSHAIDANLAQNERRLEGSPAYPLAVVADDDGDLGFAILSGDQVFAGTGDDPLEPVEGAVVDGTAITQVPGFDVLDRQAVIARQGEVTTLRVPFSEDAEDGSVRTQDGRQGFQYRSVLVYDDAADTMTDVETGVVYRPNEIGQFEADDGTTLPVGWRAVVGFDNFTTAFTDTRYSVPFLRVLAWTFVFAVASVAITFFFGLFLAMVLNEPRLRGQRILRALLILPYAFPAFMAFLLWRGMLNRDFGFVNTVLLGGANINWLGDPWLAKLAVLGVQLWVGFPYMFLICTGALQAIPKDMVEAARVDGAGPLRVWRSITLPLLLVATGPLLIASFAFNFNNFNIIEFVTGGGPRFPDASVPVGATDILITMVYSISGLDGTAPANYGLASALSIIIFLIVATISAVSFRMTRRLEEVN